MHKTPRHNISRHLPPLQSPQQLLPIPVPWASHPQSAWSAFPAWLHGLWGEEGTFLSPLLLLRAVLAGAELPSGHTTAG